MLCLGDPTGGTKTSGGLHGSNLEMRVRRLVKVVTIIIIIKCICARSPTTHGFEANASIGLVSRNMHLAQWFSACCQSCRYRQSVGSILRLFFGRIFVLLAGVKLVTVILFQRYHNTISSSTRHGNITVCMKPHFPNIFCCRHDFRVCREPCRLFDNFERLLFVSDIPCSSRSINGRRTDPVSNDGIRQ